MKKLIILILILVITLFTYSKEVTYEILVNSAMKNNSTIKVKDLELKKISNNLKIINTDNFPTIKLSDRVNKDENREKLNYSNSISLDKKIFDGGLKKYNKKKENVNIQMKNIEISKEKKQIKYEILVNYLDILKYKNQKNIYENSLKELEKEQEKQKLLYKEKAGKKQDLLTIETEILDVKANMIKNNSNYLITIEELKRITGENEEIELKNIEYEKMYIDLEKDIENYKKSSDDIKNINLQNDINMLDKKIIKSKDYPVVSFNANYSSNSDELSKIFKDWDWSLGVSLSYDIFDGGKKKIEYENSDITGKINKMNSDEIIKENIIAIKKKYYELKNDELLIENQNKKIEGLEENYKIVKIQYEYGVEDINTFLKIKNDLENSKINLINLKLDYILKYAEYRMGL
ncbi:TolC family protein [Haliovirga abyssi]|uniref:Transporter n=1 Tax=Haliovirga abyssi TaxID=2996794 RepID=A0AAU9DUI1_9FUSO|nr:TolC family protein [Haliovirga abyssi]BDU50949.1 transporter [Haliovirga abyssi]